MSVTDPHGRIIRPGVPRPPQTATEMAKFFKESELGKRNRQEIVDYSTQFVGKSDRAQAYKQSARQESAKRSSRRSEYPLGLHWFDLILFRGDFSPYLLSLPQQIHAVVLRRVQILRGSMFFTGINLLYVQARFETELRA